MELLESFREKATKLKRHIVLPEGEDERMLKAAQQLRAGICEVTLIDPKKSVKSQAESLGLDLSGVHVVHPDQSEMRDKYAEEFYRIRKHKGLSRDEAEKMILQPLYFGAMMVRMGDADGSVAGAVNTTGDVLKAGIQCIGLAEGIKIVSSIFLMIAPEWDRPLTYADAAVVPDPDAEQLASIAISSAQTHKKLTGIDPVVAMLSFSTYGSADHPLVDKVREATRLVRKQAPGLAVDGELQLDAAIVPSVGSKKAPGSPVAGKANVLIFPDLNAGNIGYKLTQRLAGAEAIGPIIQGLAKPANDLSRGCSVEDIVTVSAICALMA